MPAHNATTISLRAPDGASAALSLHGGQLMSWIPAGAGECLYQSPLSRGEGGQAVRGGVPVIFPQFAAQGPLTRHGLARTRAWQLAQQETGRDDALAVLRFEDDAETRALWPQAFVLELTVRIKAQRLEMELAVQNRGDTAFDFQAALHSYWRVEDATRLVIEGLQDRRYLDALRGQEGVQHSRRLELLAGQAIDRVVYGPAAPLQLLELGQTRTSGLSIQGEGFDDAVIWNPGPEHGPSDLPADGWRQFVCVELAQLQHRPRLQPGDEWVARQTVDLI